MENVWKVSLVKRDMSIVLAERWDTFFRGTEATYTVLKRKGMKTGFPTVVGAACPRCSSFGSLGVCPVALWVVGR